MPDNTPNIRETDIATSLALALASIYLPPTRLASLEKGRIAVEALLASLALVREAQGRPVDWIPGAADWQGFIAQLNVEIAAEQVKIDALPPEPPAAPTG